MCSPDSGGLGQSLTQVRVVQEAELVLVAAPAEVVLERPFTVQLKLRNQVDRLLGPLHVTLSPSAGEHVWQLQKGCNARAMLLSCPGVPGGAFQGLLLSGF